MKRKFLKVISVVLAAICIFGQTAFALQFSTVVTARNNSDFAIKSAEIIKKYDEKSKKNQLNSISESLRIIGKTSSTNFNFQNLGAASCVRGNDGRFLLQFESRNAMLNCLDFLKKNEEIIYAEQDQAVYTCSEESSETTPLSWGTTQIGADEYSEHVSNTVTDRNVTVAIIDSGVEKIEFVADKLINGYDFINVETGGATDTSVDSHGTFLASIVVDCTKKANVSIMPVRVLDSKSGSLVNAVNGIYYAVDNGADVINVSLGGELSDCSSLDDAIAYADEKNVTVVVCSGNNKINIKNYCPAHNTSAITVSAVNENLAFASGFSNYGEAVDMCAPGVNIVGYSADGTIKTMNGTSMSAAYISACASLFRLQHPECNTSQVQNAIKKSCTDLGSAGFDMYYGYGIPEFENFITDETVYAQRIAFAENEIVITVGESKTIGPVFTPENSTDKSVEWTSSSPETVYVSPSGTITANQAGTAVITAETIDGGFSASINIIAVEPEKPPYIVSISVKNPPQKTSYTYKSDEKIDLTGLELEAVYSNGTKAVITDTTQITAKDFSTVPEGEHTVTLEYAGCQTRFNITVSYAWWQWIIRILLLGFLWY